MNVVVGMSGRVILYSETKQNCIETSI